MVMFEKESAQTRDQSSATAMPSNKYSAAIMEESNNMTATAAVNGDTPPAEGLSENDSGVELTNENSPLTAAEPPSPFSPKQNGDAASPQDGNQCSRGSRKRSRKRREDEESTWDSDKSSGASQLGLRQTPRPRTIFQAGLTPHTHGKPRRQNRKQEHGTSPVNTRRAGSRAAREGAAIRNIKLHVSVHAAGTLMAGRGSSTLNNNVTTQGSARPRPSADTHPSTSGWGRGGQPRPSQPRLDKEVLVFHREL